jgi:hypothetical protein
LARKERTVKHSWDYRLELDDERHDWTAPDCLFRTGGQGGEREDLNAIWRALASAGDAGRPASFPVPLVLAWQLSGQGLEFRRTDRLEDAYGEAYWVRPPGIDGKLVEHVHRILEGSMTKTLLWSHARAILGVGAKTDRIAILLAPHHAIAEPPALARWKDALNTWNPWRSGGKGGLPESERWTSLCADAVRELGFPIAGTVTRWREQVAKKWARPRAPARLATPEEAQGAHETLAALAARPWDVEASSPAWPLRLDAAARARLTALPGHGEREAIHVVANLGAGRLLRIQVVRFLGEKQAAFQQCGGDLEVDGGDVHIWFEPLGDPLLEGCTLPTANGAAPRPTTDSASE